jgi:predicted nucleic acid-binding protein
MNDLSKFRLSNVADTCSIWNLLSSLIVWSASRQQNVTICCTQFVQYECLHKPGRFRPERVELQKRLRREIEDGRLRCFNIELEDLQDVEALSKRKKVSSGELSSMVFAKRTCQAFLSDDRKASKLAATIIASDHVQSTTHLIGWLYFEGKLQDSDKDKITAELKQFDRNLQPHLDRAYEEALRCRLMSSNPGT